MGRRRWAAWLQRAKKKENRGEGDIKGRILGFRAAEGSEEPLSGGGRPIRELKERPQGLIDP